MFALRVMNECGLMFEGDGEECYRKVLKVMEGEHVEKERML